jgi:spore coat protein U-like protein
MSIRSEIKCFGHRSWLLRLALVGILYCLSLLISQQAQASCTVSGTTSSSYTYTAATINNDATINLSGTISCYTTLLGTLSSMSYICMGVVFDGITTEVDDTTLSYGLAGTLGGAGDSSALEDSVVYGPVSTVETSDVLSYSFDFTVPGQSDTLVAFPAGSYVGTATVYWQMQATSLSCSLASLVTGLVNYSSGSQTLTATYVVPEYCQIDSTSSVDFGKISSAGSLTADQDAEGAINTTCNSGTAYTIYLGDGENKSGDDRQMYSASTGEYLPYQLYQDSSHATVWDETGGTDATDGSGGVSGTGTGATQETVVYGRIASGTSLPSAGSYTDSVIATLTY